MAITRRRPGALRLRSRMEVEMKTNGIVVLSKLEIDRVSGGRSVVDRFWDSLMRWLDGMSGPPAPFTIPLSTSDIADLPRIFESIGGSVSQSGSLAAGTLNIRLTSGDGTFTFVNVTGIH